MGGGVGWGGRNLKAIKESGGEIAETQCDLRDSGCRGDASVSCSIMGRFKVAVGMNSMWL